MVYYRTGKVDPWAKYELVSVRVVKSFLAGCACFAVKCSLDRISKVLVSNDSRLLEILSLRTIYFSMYPILVDDDHELNELDVHSGGWERGIDGGVAPALAALALARGRILSLSADSSGKLA